LSDFSLYNMAKVTAQNWMGFFVPQERIYILYLLTAAVMAWFVWLVETREEAEAGRPRPKFLTWLFPREIYAHNSAKQDYFIFYVNGLIYYGIAAQFLMTERPFAVLARRGLVSLFGPLDHPVLTGVAAVAAFTVATALLYDLGVYLMHLMTHKIPALWAFHKVHHSAEVLTPLTLLRMHPVDLFLNLVLVSLLTGAGLGLFSYLAAREVTDIRVLEINVLLFAFYFAGYNLRHSHIWLHYPPWLAKILISPAQHQIHHSTAPRHFDKNFGLMFSFWDRLFGSVYDPKEKEEIVFGISRKERNPYSSMKALYVQPFTEIRDLARARLKKEGPAGALGMTGTAAGLLGLTILYFQLTSYAAGGLMAPPSVYLEDLTWTEIYQAQHNGYDTVIIPAGGTEQNGPHMTLGKHNYIVHATSGEIAKRLGNALVAPVIAYVPEGDIEPKLTENMQWTGTVGVPAKVLEDTLYWAATSFKQHGFKYIYFIGDHGFDQEPQQHVADKLSALWKKDGVTVAQIGNYYFANGQDAWLQKKGFSEKDIGWHAAIRDTSEMMAIHPEGIRADPVTVKGLPPGPQGNPSLATKEIGQKMIDLKIEAAVAQMRAVRAGKK